MGSGAVFFNTSVDDFSTSVEDPFAVTGATEMGAVLAEDLDS